MYTTCFSDFNPGEVMAGKNSDEHDETSSIIWLSASLDELLGGGRREECGGKGEIIEMVLAVAEGSSNDGAGREEREVDTGRDKAERNCVGKKEGFRKQKFQKVRYSRK